MRDLWAKCEEWPEPLTPGIPEGRNFPFRFRNRIVERRLRASPPNGRAGGVVYGARRPSAVIPSLISGFGGLR